MCISIFFIFIYIYILYYKPFACKPIVSVGHEFQVRSSGFVARSRAADDMVGQHGRDERTRGPGLNALSCACGWPISICVSVCLSVCLSVCRGLSACNASSVCLSVCVFAPGLFVCVLCVAKHARVHLHACTCVHVSPIYIYITIYIYIYMYCCSESAPHRS